MSMSRKKVLWVDDEIEFLRSHIMFLETRGYSVIPVFNGDDAIHIISEKPGEFDIVLLDEQMPGRNGLDTLVVLKDIAPDLPVVMVTKSEEEQVMESAMGLNIDGYLTKPVNPSQILQVCKQLLHSKEIMSSQIKHDFVRSYSSNRAAIQNKMDIAEWVSLYKKLTKWDLRLKGVKDEGIRQAHLGQKSDADKTFSNFVSAHYMQWMQGKGKVPLFSPQVLDQFVVPLVKKDERVVFIILDSMRLDQYYMIQPKLREYYTIEDHFFFSILPSSAEFSRPALLSGLYPKEIAQEYPKIWAEFDKEFALGDKQEASLHKKKLAKSDIKSDMVEYLRFADEKNAQTFLKNKEKYSDKKLVTIVVDFFDLFIREQMTTKILRDIAPDEVGFRDLTEQWFDNSRVSQIFSELASQDVTVVFTSSNGSNLCTRGAEYYGDQESMKTLRYSYGEKITCDERYAFYMHEPELFNLPKGTEETSCIALRENYYFVNRDTYADYTDQYQNSFQQGGVSMYEMIVPLAIMRPKDQ